MSNGGGDPRRHSQESVALFFWRSDVPERLREFFRGRGIEPPLAVALRFVQRLNDRGLKMIALDRDRHETLKLAVRKRIAEGQEKK